MYARDVEVIFLDKKNLVVFYLFHFLENYTLLRKDVNKRKIRVLCENRSQTIAIMNS